LTESTKEPACPPKGEGDCKSHQVPARCRQIRGRGNANVAEAANFAETMMLQQRDRATIRRLVEELPEPYREAVVLREINDLSYEEIAEVAGVPVGTVTSRLARARAMLRSAWNAAETTAKPGSATDCAEFEVVLHALIDGELVAGHAGEGVAHVVACSACAEKLASFRAMREAMARAALKEAAPTYLRNRVEASLSDPRIDLSLRARALPRLAAWGTGAKSGNARGRLLSAAKLKQ
jgi:hypothetical protein